MTCARHIRPSWPAALLISLLAGPAAAQGFGMHVPARNEMLRVVRHEIQLQVQHPVAELVVTQEFENPYNANLEAFFVYPVPPGATVNGLALWVNGVRREARLLERQRAREIYQGIVRRKRDPALLEKTEGNGFRVRIFPVLAHSRTRVEIRLAQPVQPLPGGGYQLVLQPPPGSTVHSLRLGLDLRAGFELAQVALEGYSRGRLQRPSASRALLAMPTSAASFERPIRLRYRARGPVAALGVGRRSGEQQVFVADLPAPQPGQRPARRVALLVDRSASMARRWPQVARLAAELVRALPRQDRVSLSPFGLLPEPGVEPARAGESQARRIGGLLQGLSPAGGTAFVPVVEHALAQGVDRLVLLTDGGSRYHRAELEQVLRRVYDQQDRAVSVAAFTAAGAAEQEALSELAAITGGTYRRVAADSDLGQLARELVQGGARQRLDGAVGPVRVLRSGGGRLLVAGRLDGSAGAPRLRQGGRVVQLAAEDCVAAGALYATAAIDEAMRAIKLFGETEERRQAVVQLSMAHHVLSEYTALLATETDADYGRPVSGRKWQRRSTSFEDQPLPATYEPTPEPHEWALMILGALLLLVARRRRQSSTHPGGLA